METKYVFIPLADIECANKLILSDGYKQRSYITSDTCVVNGAIFISMTKKKNGTN